MGIFLAQREKKNSHKVVHSRFCETIKKKFCNETKKKSVEKKFASGRRKFSPLSKLGLGKNAVEGEKRSFDGRRFNPVFDSGTDRYFSEFAFLRRPEPRFPKTLQYIL